VGGGAFGLSHNVIRPYAGKNLPLKKRVFNHRLSRARRFIECAFGIMSNKWRIFHRLLNISKPLAENIIKACVLLTNYVRVRDSNSLSFEDTLSYGGFQEEDERTDNYPVKTPTTIRDKFADYFMGEGGDN